MARGAERGRTKESFWRRMLRRQAGSGLSIRAWCARHGLRESAFYRWRRQLARRDAEAASFAPVWASSFVPVKVTAESSSPSLPSSPTSPTSPSPPTSPTSPMSPTSPSSPGRIEIELPGDWWVHLVGPVDRQGLADVLAVLTGPPWGVKALGREDRPLGEVRPC